MSGLDLTWRTLAGIAGLLFALPAVAAPFPAGDSPRIAIGVAAFESSGPAGASGPDVARLLADRIGTHGVHAVVGPGELGAAGNGEPTPAQIQSWAAAAAVSTIAVGRATWIGGRQSIDVRLRTGDSGGLLGTYVAEATTPEELASGIDRLAGEIVAATAAWLKGDGVRAAPPRASREAREPRDPSDSPFGIGGFDSDQPLSIHADELEASQSGGTRRLVFKKGVRVQQADLTLEAARLEAFYPEKASQPERLVASGGVKVVQGLREARCDQAVYFRSEQRLHCEGNAELRDGDDRVTGARIEFDLAAERVVVKGGASVLFHPEPDPEAKATPAARTVFPTAGPGGAPASVAP